MPLKRNPMFIAASWCMLLIIFRCVYFQNFGFLFMAWNLFLAWLPWQVFQASRGVLNRHFKTLVIITGFILLPNAPYMLTDLIHLEKDLQAPLWYDLLLISSCAFCGLLFFLRSVDVLMDFIRNYFRQTESIEPFLQLTVFALCAYGIYLGRWLRLNSWDIVAKPMWMAQRISTEMTVPEWYLCFKITLLYGAFLFFLYRIYRLMILELLLNQQPKDHI